MKPESIIFGIAAGLAALLGFCLALTSLLLLCTGFSVNPYAIVIAGVAGIYLFYRGGSAFKNTFGVVAVIEEDFRSVEERLDELERLKRRDLISPEEYAAKRQEILKGL